MAEIGLLFLAGGGLGSLALYWLISSETATPEVLDRETAEREAREVGGLDGPGRRRQSSRPDERDDDDL